MAWHRCHFGLQGAQVAVPLRLVLVPLRLVLVPLRLALVPLRLTPIPLRLAPVPLRRTPVPLRFWNLLPRGQKRRMIGLALYRETTSTAPCGAR